MKTKFLHFILLVCITRVNAQLCFSPETDYPVGIYPSSLCHADFNGDGKTDLAAANRTGSVSILLGNGAGSFVTGTDFTVGYLPYSICTADFNGDSIPDLATANRGPWNISVIFGDGTGSFGTDSTFGVANPRALISADFNKDDKADLAVAFYGSIMIMPGNGAGGFTAPSNMLVSNGVSALTSADFNGDTIPDLATANGGSSNISILLGDGAGGFAPPDTFATGDAPSFIISDDFNDDRNADLATANTANNVSGNISVLLGNGTGSFGSATNFPIGIHTVPQSLCSADFNGDDETDLAIAAVANNSFPNVSILEGNGAGSFGAATTFAVDSFPNSVISADFNGDEKMDLAVVTVYTNNDSGKIDVLLNCNTTGINDPAVKSNQVQLYPNPGNGIFIVRINGEVQGETGEMEVCNVLGERVYSSSIAHAQTSNQLDLSQLPAGIFFAKIRLGWKIFNEKIVKK